MNKKLLSLSIRLDEITEAQAIAIEDMLAVWQTLGSLGASRWTKFYADGDGNFHPSVTIDGNKPRRYVHPQNGKKPWGNYAIDFDEIAWLLHDHKKEDLQQ